MAVQRQPARCRAARAGPASSRWSAARDDAIAITTSPAATRSGPSSVVGLDDAAPVAGDVVLVGRQQARVLGGLAADQRAAGLRRSASAMPFDDRGDPLRHDLAAGDVVGHEQRLGAARRPGRRRPSPTRSKPIVSCMSMRLGDGDLGADAVGRGGQQRVGRSGLSARGVEQPGEAADAADHLGPAGLVDPRLHQLDGLVAGLDDDAGRGVGRAGSAAARSGRLRAPSAASRGVAVRVGRGRRRRRRRPATPAGRRRRSTRRAPSSSRCLPSSSASGSAIG